MIMNLLIIIPLIKDLAKASLETFAGNGQDFQLLFLSWPFLKMLCNLLEISPSTLRLHAEARLDSLANNSQGLQLHLINKPYIQNDTKPTNPHTCDQEITC